MLWLEDMVSQEVVARLRRDQLMMLVLLARLVDRATHQGDTELMSLAQSLRDVVGEHVKLLEGVLEVFVADNPPDASDPEQESAAPIDCSLEPRPPQPRPSAEPRPSEPSRSARPKKRDL
jgi:hypothetical protein